MSGLSGSSSGSARLLMLWDVDFTLMNATGVKQKLYYATFYKLFGRELPTVAAAASMAGKTDRAIALDVLRLAEVPDPRGAMMAFETALARLGRGAHGMVAESGK